MAPLIIAPIFLPYIIGYPLVKLKDYISGLIYEKSSRIKVKNRILVLEVSIYILEFIVAYLLAKLLVYSLFSISIDLNAFVEWIYN